MIFLILIFIKNLSIACVTIYFQVIYILFYHFNKQLTLHEMLTIFLIFFCINEIDSIFLKNEFYLFGIYSNKNNTHFISKKKNIYKMY